MCDVSKARFFRPWKAEEVGKNDETDIIVEATRILQVNDDITIKKEEKVHINEKCENSRENEDDDDNVSVLSSLSYGDATSDTGSYRCHRDSRRKRGRENTNRRQRISSSCSLNSDDINVTGSLDMLSNFVLGDNTDEQNGCSKNEISMIKRNSSSSSSSSDNSSCNSRNSPQSAFTSTSYQCPIYSSLDYLTPLRIGHFGNVENAAAVAAAAVAAAASFDPNYSSNSHHHHHHHNNILYGLTSLPITSYGSSMEEAVKYIHQQDVAAKQMKKLRPKKFRCEHCDVAFSNNGQLKGHVRIHTGERPFKCDADGCGKSFTRNEELTRHKRIHTGLRPHSCVLCGKRFGRKDHLKKHTRTHDNRAAYHIPASALGPFGLGHHHSLPPGHPISSYIYPI